jgi:UDP-3-O-[3-hydroxymyristoyl] N-acetylglucosamine deacetylase
MIDDQAAADISVNLTGIETVLIVDDEESIRRTLEGVFCDEGFNVVTAGDGEAALKLVKEVNPALVILDIWMPGMDGLRTLEKIKAVIPDLPVIMISGHASIPTAVQATRMGAVDFIEKPLDLEATLFAAKKALGRVDQEETEEKETGQPSGKDGFFLDDVSLTAEVSPVVFSSQALKGADLGQKTLQKSTVLYGHGVHTGRKSGLLLEPLPADSGIHFVGVSETTVVPAHVDYVDSSGWATTLRSGQTQVSTVEHLMSTLHAYGVTNLLVKCNGEVPVMDGSAIEFCNLIEEVGLENQKSGWYEIEIDRTYEINKGKEFIRLEPSEIFTVDYTLHYPEPVGRQQYVFELVSGESFKEEIAPARTFGFVKDIGELQKQGLAQGGRFDNFVLLGEEGAINSRLRFEDEPVRHKILDVLGDLYLLGRKIKGKVTASMTGHSDNISLLKMLREEMRGGK